MDLDVLSPNQPTQSFDALAEVFDRLAELRVQRGEPLNHYLAAVLPGDDPGGDPGDAEAEQGGRRRGSGGSGGSGRAVDLGCGAGHHAILLARHHRYREVLAIDLSAAMLAIARTRRPHPSIRYEQRDLATVYPERDGRFDLVFSVATLHHVALDDLDQTLWGIRELAAPGGQVVLADYVADQPAVPRRQFVRQARRTLLCDLVGWRCQRRRLGEAIEFYRLNTRRGWLDHVTTDRFLSATGFAERYGRVFPGAEFTTLPWLCAMRWQAEGS